MRWLADNASPPWLYPTVQSVVRSFLPSTERGGEESRVARARCAQRNLAATFFSARSHDGRNTGGGNLGLTHPRHPHSSSPSPSSPSSYIMSDAPKQDVAPALKTEESAAPAATTAPLSAEEAEKETFRQSEWRTTRQSLA